MVLLAILGALTLGYGIGLMQNGINIKISRNLDDIPKEYNKFDPNMLDNEVRQYYDTTNGYNKF